MRMYIVIHCLLLVVRFISMLNIDFHENNINYMIIYCVWCIGQHIMMYCNIIVIKNYDIFHIISIIMRLCMIKHQALTPRLSGRLQQRTNGYQPNKKNGYHGIVTQQFIEGGDCEFKILRISSRLNISKEDSMEHIFTSLNIGVVLQYL